MGRLIDAIENDRWFGDQDKYGRLSVDFILKDARLIIELEGHEHYSTKEQLEKDAISLNQTENVLSGQITRTEISPSCAGEITGADTSPQPSRSKRLHFYRRVRYLNHRRQCS